MKPPTVTRIAAWFLEIAAIPLVVLCGLDDPLFWPVSPWPYALLAAPLFAVVLLMVVWGEGREA